MGWLRKYYAYFSLALAADTVHRLNFLLYRMRELIFFTTLLFLYSSFKNGLGDYSQDELSTYILLTNVVLLMGYTHILYLISDEIAEGEVMNYLVKPVNYLGAGAARQLSRRILFGIFSFIDVAVLLWLVPAAHFIFPTTALSWLEFGVELWFASNFDRARMRFPGAFKFVADVTSKLKILHSAVGGSTVNLRIGVKV